MRKEMEMRFSIILTIATVTFISCRPPTEDMPTVNTYAELNVVRVDGSGHQIIADGGWGLIPTDSAIIFANGNFKVFKVNYDGSNLSQLYANISWGEYALSPRGDKILLASAIFESNNYLSELYLMNPNGTNLIKLSPSKGWYAWPRISPDLDEIVFYRDGGIATIKVDGSGLTFIKTKTDTTSCSYSTYIDENNILYFENINSLSYLKVFNKTTGEHRLLGTNSGGFPAFTRTVVDTNILITDLGIIKVINIKTGEISRVGTGWEASFSSDGSKIVAYQDKTIYIMDASGQNRQAIYTVQDSKKSIGSALFSPDSKYVVFQTTWSVYSF